MAHYIELVNQVGALENNAQPTTEYRDLLIRAITNALIVDLARSIPEEQLTVRAMISLKGNETPLADFLLGRSRTQNSVTTSESVDTNFGDFQIRDETPVLMPDMARICEDISKAIIAVCEANLQHGLVAEVDSNKIVIG